MYFWIRFISLMGKIAGYLTEKRGGYDQKDAQSIGKNNGKITKQAVCKKSKQFLNKPLQKYNRFFLQSVPKHAHYIPITKNLPTFVSRKGCHTVNGLRLYPHEPDAGNAAVGKNRLGFFPPFVYRNENKHDVSLSGGTYYCRFRQ